MKKIMISLLLVPLTICLFVGCSPEPKEDLPQSVSFAYSDRTMTFNRDGSGTYTEDGDSYSITYTISQNEGLNAIVGGDDMPFYKDENNTKITSFDELFSLSSILYNKAKATESPNWENWTKQ